MTTHNGPWAPYEPTADDPWDLRKVAHLHRRAGFGGTWAELRRDLTDGPEASVARLLKPRPLGDEERQVLASLRQGVLDSGDADRLKAWWLYRILYDPDPLREKLTLFWHGHCATSNRKVDSVPRMLAQNETLRRHALGPLADLLTAMVADPAMLIWLDGAGSKKEKPNENFAREFFELFSLGVGPYAEKDVREAARAFTGWSVDGLKSTFDTAAHDAGSKTLFGQTGAWKSEDVVRLTLARPECAVFLARKLYRFFVSETAAPTPQLLEPLAEELRKSKYDIAQVVGIVLRSKPFFAAANRRQRVKGPVDYAAGLVRSLEVPRGDVRLLALALACERQGQDLFYPPNVKGWDGGKTWLTSTTVLERGNWASDVVWGNADFGLKPYDPLAWAARQGIAADKAAAALADLTLQGDVSAAARGRVERAADGTSEGQRKVLQLLINCPEYQLA